MRKQTTNEPTTTKRKGLADGARLKNVAFMYLATLKDPVPMAKAMYIGDGDDVRRRIANVRATYFCDQAPKRKDGCGGWHVDNIVAPRCTECEKYAWNIWKKKQQKKWRKRK